MNIEQYVDLIKENKLEEALELSRQYLLNNPAQPHFYYNHAMLAWELNKKEEAIQYMTMAKQRLPECPVIRRFLGEFLLSTGQFAKGFREKENRFQFPLYNSPRPGIPIWAEILPRIRQCYKAPTMPEKTVLEDKTILVFCEGGFGDLIMNSRYLETLKEKTKAKIILEVKPELELLFQGIKGVDEIITSNKRVSDFVMTFMLKEQNKLPEHDYVVSSESLSYHYDINLKQKPMDQYLFPKEAVCGAVDIIKKYDKKKIGIVWAGNEKEEKDRWRSCYKNHFRPLSELDNVQLFSLQKGKMNRVWERVNVNLLELSEGMNVVDLQEHLENFNDTALVIQNLDLVISVDTAVAHLAGALGKPVWLILPKEKPDWRWQKSWYKSLKTFRQETTWEDLFQKMKQSLK